MKSKEFIAFVFFLIFPIACNPGQGIKTEEHSGLLAEDKVAEVSFKEYEHDFGKITEGEKVAHIFAFENKGPGNLVISSTSTSCGCTVTKYERKPIPPGKGGSLEVVFDSNGRNGVQTKTVSVTSNSMTGVVILKITAVVIPEN